MGRVREEWDGGQGPRGTRVRCESGIVVQVFGPSTLKAEQEDLCEFETSLVYIVSS